MTSCLVIICIRLVAAEEPMEHCFFKLASGDLCLELELLYLCLLGSLPSWFASPHELGCSFPSLFVSHPVAQLAGSMGRAGCIDSGLLSCWVLYSSPAHLSLSYSVMWSLVKSHQEYGFWTLQ